MTNKEAIEILNMVNKQAKNQPHEFYEALYMAIKALNLIERIKFNVYALNKLINELEEEEP